MTARRMTHRNLVRIVGPVAAITLLAWAVDGTAVAAEIAKEAPAAAPTKVSPSAQATAKTTSPARVVGPAKEKASTKVAPKATHPVSSAVRTKKSVSAKTPAKPPAESLVAMADQARAAYWHGDIARAIADYQALIKRHPQPRWYGELGNIYYQTGRPRQAAESYYHAARALIATGRPLEAGALLPTLQRLDPVLANKLLASQPSHKESH